MSTKDKLIERFKKLPKDFSFDELTTLLSSLGYYPDNKGTTSGSRIVFKKENDRLQMHRPHPQKTVSQGCMKSLIKLLRQRKLL